MSRIQSALTFITEIRKNGGSSGNMDNKLRQEVEALEKPISLSTMVKIGEKSGLIFTTDDLIIAFKYDWQMRWKLYE